SGCTAKRHFAKAALGGTAGMLRVDLQPYPFHMGRGVSESGFVVAGEVMCFVDPAVEIGRSRTADHRENMDKGNGTGAFHGALRRRRVPNVRKDVLIDERHQNLGSLIVRMRVTEV